MNVPLIAGAALLASCLLLTASCGKGTVSFGGGDEDNKAKVTFKGDLDEVSPVTARDIVAFVYSIDDDSDRCPCPPDPSASGTGKAVVLSSGETSFTISGLEAGTFGVVFLLDNAGDLADGQIDPGDPIAILDDPDCRLDDVKPNLTVTLDDVDILFDDSPADCTTGGVDNPAPGRARARTITKVTTVSED